MNFMKSKTILPIFQLLMLQLFDLTNQNVSLKCILQGSYFVQNMSELKSKRSKDNVPSSKP